METNRKMTKDYGLRRTILAGMTRVGKIAQVRQIAEALGSEWLTARKLAALRQMLVLMDREGIVGRVGASTYVNGGFGAGWGGFGSREQITECIFSYLHEHGGTLPTDYILDAFADSRIWGPNEQDAQRLHIRWIIAEGDCFRQFFKGGQEYLALNR
jgi:hypothetical protein